MSVRKEQGENLQQTIFVMACMSTGKFSKVLKSRMFLFKFILFSLYA